MICAPFFLLTMSLLCCYLLYCPSSSSPVCLKGEKRVTYLWLFSGTFIVIIIAMEMLNAYKTETLE